MGVGKNLETALVVEGVGNQFKPVLTGVGQIFKADLVRFANHFELE